MGRLRAAVERRGERLSLKLSPALAALLRPSLSVAPVRAPADGERYGEILLRLDPEELEAFDLPISITAYRDAHEPENCLIEVLVAPAGERWPDLVGRTVTLSTPGGTHEATTDPWGVAAFEDVRTDALEKVTIDVSGLPES